MRNQFIDLKAQVDSEEELSDDEGDERLNDAGFIDDNSQDIFASASASSSTTTFSVPERTARLDTVVEQIEHRYLNTPPNQADAEPTDDPTR
ncbi:hypothetical protein GYMLUDRAFT_247545 [Collybiopsis luxurians FD-317 M1]|uniref:Spt5 transcription elongation factor N-terminal domain-containing protein n=1 Tax=Collybiopsis luxurians FD-317 M1 TaxID=944289 RepID=A0A0D0BNZ0_9AGAR|nr:hypothetical protein GYMLUDRAFT_247545 [Collybiopsis luxurians FD-317 M1]